MFKWKEKPNDNSKKNFMSLKKLLKGIKKLNLLQKIKSLDCPF